MRTDLKIGLKFNHWTVIEGPIDIKGKAHYKMRCDCGDEHIFEVRYIVSKIFSESCRKCGLKLRHDREGRKYAVGTKIQNLTILSEPTMYKGNSYYKVQCDCGHIFRTGHSTLYRKSINLALPYCNCCFIQDKKKAKRNTMLTEHISKSRYGSLMHAARDRGILFSLTPEYLEDLWNKQNGKCALSGLDISLFIRTSDRKDYTASLDRIDSSLGYVEGNVQWIHKDINYMKCDFSLKEFINYCKLISNFQANQQPSMECTP